MILSVDNGVLFKMGGGENWRIVHPDMGAEKITMNYMHHAPGVAFTQHIHDNSEDLIVILEGKGIMKQGNRYTDIEEGEAILVPPGEVHGTVNTGKKMARIISFQAPPDFALYSGVRDRKPDEVPVPPGGHRSGILIIRLDRGGPVFSGAGEWRSVFSKKTGARYLGLDYIVLKNKQDFKIGPVKTEEVYFIVDGSGEVDENEMGRFQSVIKNQVIYLKPEEKLRLMCTSDEIIFVRAYVLPPAEGHS